MTRISNDSSIASNKQRIEAITKHITNKKTVIPVDGENLNVDALTAVYQDELDKRADAATKKAAYNASVADRSKATTRRRAVDEALRPWVLNTFGSTSAVAKEFGYAPRKAPTMSARDRAAAVDANLATRKARGTMPRAEKEKIHGTPAVASAANPNPAPTPASPSPTATTASGAAPAVASK